MDIAYYLSELLEQLGEVSVPGLGSFTRVKIDGYYNNDEGKFYPPSSKIQFSQQYADDDVLARYIGVKKRISLASSKYFTEKYISNLRMEIMAKEVTLADVGSLYFDNGQVCFNPATASHDPAFFGYPQITLNKIGSEPVAQHEEPEATEPTQAPEIVQEPVEELPAPVLHDEPVIQDEEITQNEPVAQHEPVQDEAEHQDFFTPQAAVHTPQAEEEDDFIFHSVPYTGEEEEDARRSYKWLWVSLLVLLMAGGAVFAYFYLQQPETKTVKKIKAAPALKQDTTDSASSAADTTAKNKTIPAQPQNSPASTIDSTKRRYEVIGASTRTLAEANKVIDNFKSIGIDAHVVNDAPGRRLKISLGTYATNAEAMSAIKKLLKTRKVKGIWPLPINPKK